MLLSITAEHRPASDLGFLLHKHPDRFQSFDLSFGKAHVFYPEMGESCCTLCLLLDVDPIGMVRGKNGDRYDGFLLGQYVNDRPYVASSFLSVAIAQVFGAAMGGRSKDRPELVSVEIPLKVQIDVLPVRGGEGFLQRIFGPLGYQVHATRHSLDDTFPEWGESPYYSVTLEQTITISELLSHLYVLVPVFDNEKHYFVADDELDKLLSKGGSWLVNHPERELISRRYLKHRAGLYREALARLEELESPVNVPGDVAVESDDPATTPSQNGTVAADESATSDTDVPSTLNEQRYEAVLAALRMSGASSVLDLGCGEGKLLRELLRDRQFSRIVGMDVSVRALELANKRLKTDQMPSKVAERLELIHGSLMYRDQRLLGFDAALLVEVIEHLDAPKLAALEKTLFEFASPKVVIVTTPNQEYNVMWEALPAGEFRHADHRFEWNRAEFEGWASRVASQSGYSVEFAPIGPVDTQFGAPTQMALFHRVAQ